MPLDQPAAQTSMAGWDLEELESGAVLRLARVGDDFPADASTPLRKHFDLSSDDKRAAASGQPVLLSVWDLNRTTVGQAKAFRPDGGESVAFRLEVPRLRAIGVADGSRHLRVFRAPLSSPDVGKPGADGHCGIHGLERPSGEEKKIVKELQVRLTEIAVRLE